MYGVRDPLHTIPPVLRYSVGPRARARRRRGRRRKTDFTTSPPLHLTCKILPHTSISPSHPQLPGHQVTMGGEAKTNMSTAASSYPKLAAHPVGKKVCAMASLLRAGACQSWIVNKVPRSITFTSIACGCSPVVASMRSRTCPGKLNCRWIAEYSSSEQCLTSI
jgi:hypothetical protein